MTKQELNRDIKRLYKAFLKRKSGDTSNWTAKDWQNYEQQEDELKKEFSRLYYADKEMKYITLENLKIMIVLNNSLRVIALHSFGNYIKL